MGNPSKLPRLPDRTGHFGAFGGRYVPETLMTPLLELETAYREARRDPPSASPSTRGARAST